MTALVNLSVRRIFRSSGILHWVRIGAPLCALALLFPLYETLREGSPPPRFDSFQPPEREVSGISYDGRSLYMTIDGRNVIYEVDERTMRTRRTIPFAERESGGSAWDGHHLWQIAWLHKRIYKLDPSSGRVLESFPSPGSGMCSGMTFDGTYLWVANFDDRKIYQIDQSHGGRILRALDGLHETAGLAWDGQFLWNGIVVGALDHSETPYAGFIEQRDIRNDRSLAAFAVNGVGPGTTDWLPGSNRGRVHWWYDGYHNRIVRITFSAGRLWASICSLGAAMALLIAGSVLAWRGELRATRS